MFKLGEERTLKGGTVRIKLLKDTETKQYQVWVYAPGQSGYLIEYCGTLKGARAFAKEEYQIS